MNTPQSLVESQTNSSMLRFLCSALRSSIPYERGESINKQSVSHRQQDCGSISADNPYIQAKDICKQRNQLFQHHTVNRLSSVS